MWRNHHFSSQDLPTWLTVSSFLRWNVVQIVSRDTSYPCSGLIARRMQYVNNQNPEIKSGFSVHAKTCILRNNLRFNRTVWNWNLFLAHPTCGNECSTPESTQNFTRKRFWIFKTPSKVWVLEQSQSTMLRRITHIAISSVITRVVNVRNQTSQAFPTCSCPLCHCSCRFVYRPSNVKSTNACQLQAIQDDLSPDFWQLSSRFLFLSFALMVVNAWCRDYMQLLNKFVCQFAIFSFHPFLRMSFHVVGPRINVCTNFLRFTSLSVSPAEIRDSNIFCIRLKYFRLVYIRVECIRNSQEHEMM